jgi:hypothetical protein
MDNKKFDLIEVEDKMVVAEKQEKKSFQQMIHKPRKKSWT